MKLPVLSAEGKELRTMEVDDSVFGIAPNASVLHQAYVTQRNNLRAGSARTKTRSEVQGSSRKVRRQKYTGRARAGTARSPTRVGGGVAFGPRPRSFAQDLPKKMRRLAIRSALSGKVADGELVVIDQIAIEKPRTHEIARILANAGITGSALIVTAAPDRTVLASVRNLTKTKALPANYLNVLDMLNHAGLLITEEAVHVAEGLWGTKGAKAPAPRVRKPATKAEAAPGAEPPREAAPAKPRRRKAASEAAEPTAEAAAPEALIADKPTRTRKPKAAAEPNAATEGEAETPAATVEEKPKRTRTAAKAKADATPAEEAPKPRRRTKKQEGG